MIHTVRKKMEPLTILKINSVDATLTTKEPTNPFAPPSQSVTRLTALPLAPATSANGPNRAGCTIFSRREEKKVKVHCFSYLN